MTDTKTASHFGLPASHISFEAEHDIRQIIKPLEKMGGIKFFSYGTNYPDTSGYTLHTNSNYYKSWFEHKMPLPSFYLKSGWYFADKLLSNNVLTCANNEGLGNFLIYINHMPNKSLIFAFATDPDNPMSAEFYLNHMGMLKRFGHYFSESIGKQFIDLAEQQRVIPFPVMTKNDSHQEDTATPESNILDTLNEKEKKYLKYILEGHSVTEIGDLEDRSCKTIFNYVSSIRKKLNCDSKLDIFDKLEANGVIRYYLNHPIFDFNHLEDEALKSALIDIYYPLHTLSQREYDCYQLVLKGYSLDEIGKQIGIGIPTVADYIKRLKAKLGCMHKKDLFKQAIGSGFMDISSMIES
ncbi:MAG: hypothetical protein JSR17_09260 [Proteobacteria bacterium]|nr:hypothetical protein [Pseudomonadota bacterium]